MKYIFDTLAISYNKAEFIEYHIDRLLNTAINEKYIDNKKDYYGYILENLPEHLDYTSGRLNLFIYENGDFSWTQKEYVQSESNRLIILNEYIRKKDMEYFKDNQYHDLYNLYSNKIQDDVCDLLMVNENKDITECLTSNIFFLKNDFIVTPKLTSGVFPGIIRKILLKEFNIKEETINITDLDSFDSVFITNSLKKIRSIKSIDSIFFTPAVKYVIKFNNFIEQNCFK